MLDITTYTVERIRDHFGILPGNRYEFKIDVEVDEEDELYTENGLCVRVIFKDEEGASGIVKYELLERITNKYWDYDLEEEELQFVEAFCREHYKEADEDE